MKTKKQMKKVPVDYMLHWTYGVTVEKIREDLDILEKLGVVEVLIETDWNNNIQIEAYVNRLETDEEYKKRIEEERLQKEALKLRELQYLEKLKKKYESKL